MENEIMRKVIIFITLLILGINGFGQSKKQIWENVGGQFIGWKPDTINVALALKGKDSVSVKIETDNCGRLTAWIDYEGRTHGTKNMVRKSIGADFWRWQKNYTVVGKDTINRGKPRWEISSGMGYMYSGFYTQNGKFIQPEYVIDKYGKHKVN